MSSLASPALPRTPLSHRSDKNPSPKSSPRKRTLERTDKPHQQSQQRNTLLPHLKHQIIHRQPSKDSRLNSVSKSTSTSAIRPSSTCIGMATPRSEDVTLHGRHAADHTPPHHCSAPIQSGPACAKKRTGALTKNMHPPSRATSGRWRHQTSTSATKLKSSSCRTQLYLFTRTACTPGSITWPNTHQGSLSTCAASPLQAQISTNYRTNSHFYWTACPISRAWVFNSRTLPGAGSPPKIRRSTVTHGGSGTWSIVCT